jgi:methionyl-tRNA synthetase
MIFDADAIAGFEEIGLCDITSFHCVSWPKQIDGRNSVSAKDPS